MMIYMMVQYDTLKKDINQRKKYYLDTSKYNSKNHLEIQKQS